MTHLVAVAGDATRAVAAAGEDGAVELDLRAGQPYALVLVDASRTGAAMVAATWRAGALETVIVAEGRDLDLGRLAISGGHATGELDGDELLAELGLDAATAATIGALDDLAARHANPDVDGDGQLDALQPGRDARLELRTEHVMLAAAGGARATIDDLLGPGAVELAHAGTAISLRVPAAYDFDRDDCAARFEQPFHGITGGVAVAPYPAGHRISGDQLTYGADRRFGVYASAGFDLPSGAYRFESAGQPFELVGVRPPPAAALAELTDQLMPFVRLVPRDPSCTAGCTLAGIELAWRRRTGAGWVAAGEAELAVLGPRGRLDVVTRDGDHVQLALPGDAASAQLAWDADTARLDGLTPDELAALTTDQMAWLSVTGEPRLGLTTSAWAAAPL